MIDFFSIRSRAIRRISLQCKPPCFALGSWITSVSAFITQRWKLNNHYLIRTILLANQLRESKVLWHKHCKKQARKLSVQSLPLTKQIRLYFYAALTLLVESHNQKYKVEGKTDIGSSISSCIISYRRVLMSLVSALLTALWSVTSVCVRNSYIYKKLLVCKTPILSIKSQRTNVM